MRTNEWRRSKAVDQTYASTFQKILALVQAARRIGEVYESFLCLRSCGMVRSFIQFFAQKFQLRQFLNDYNTV